MTFKGSWAEKTDLRSGTPNGCFRRFVTAANSTSNGKLISIAMQTVFSASGKLIFSTVIFGL